MKQEKKIYVIKTNHPETAAGGQIIPQFGYFTSLTKARWCADKNNCIVGTLTPGEYNPEPKTEKNQAHNAKKSQPATTTPKNGQKSSTGQKKNNSQGNLLAGTTSEPAKDKNQAAAAKK